MSKILFVVNDPAFFLSHRLPIALAAKAEGHEVHVATAAGKASDDIRAYGFPFHVLPLSRSGRNLLHELASLIAIYCLFRSLKPDLVHLVTIKPVLYGGIAARLARVQAVVAAVSGLGFVFLASGFKARIVRVVVTVFYRFALGHKNLRVIFQNTDDRDLLVGLKVLPANKAVIIRGSGVDLSICKYVPEPEGIPVVVMASRLLKDKGVWEFVFAAKEINARGVSARFILAGDMDQGNPASLSLAEIEFIKQDGAVIVTGYCADIASLFSTVHVVVLPSYREGLPKVLVEAAACGRAVVTTNVPGCRDAIDPDQTGLLVPAYDGHALADAVVRLLEQPKLRQSMGATGRVLAENEFDIKRIVQKHLDVYHELIQHTAV